MLHALGLKKSDVTVYSKLTGLPPEIVANLLVLDDITGKEIEKRRSVIWDRNDYFRRLKGSRSVAAREVIIERFAPDIKLA